MMAPPLYADGVQAIISLRLPLPPSTNNLFANKKNGKGRFATQRYKDWQQAAFIALQKHRASLNHAPMRVHGRYCMNLEFFFPDGRIRDGTNYIKPAEDFCVKHGLVDDDHLCKRGTWEVSDIPGEEVRITIISTK